MSIENDITAIVEEYMHILGADGPPPIVEIRDNVGSKWLALTRWRPSDPNTSVITIQKKITTEPETLERCLAHEIIHHVQFMNMTQADIALFKRTKRSLSDGHGLDFHQMAALINSQKGENFVTAEATDSTYEIPTSGKTIHVLIEPAHMGRRLGWSWAAKLSQQQKDEISRRSKDLDDVVLVTTEDDRFTSGVKIKRYGGCSVPRPGTELEKILWEIYDEAVGELMERPVTIPDPIAFIVASGATMFIMSFFSYGLGRKQGRREMLETIKVVNEIVIENHEEPPTKKDGRPS